MSEQRTMTAAELAADSDEAREVWAAVGRGELEVFDILENHIIKAYPTDGEGDARPVTVLFDFDEGIPRKVGRNRMFTVRPTYAALEAERDAALRIVAVVNAVLATLPSEAPPKRTLRYATEWAYYSGVQRMRQAMRDSEPPHECEDCGQPATLQSADGVWLCADDYERLQRQWAQVPDGYE